jgi:hypothetical protein
LGAAAASAALVKSGGIRQTLSFSGAIRYHTNCSAAAAEAAGRENDPLKLNDDDDNCSHYYRPPRHSSNSRSQLLSFSFFFFLFFSFLFSQRFDCSSLSLLRFREAVCNGRIMVVVHSSSNISNRE